jgi:hypothetical protein
MSQSEQSPSDKHALLQLWQGPWNDDMTHGPYYKIPCDQYRKLEGLLADVRAARDNAEREANTLRDKLSAPSAASTSVPEGWKLVPIEPTDDMMRALENGGNLPEGVQVDAASWRDWARGDWANALKHVPDAPVSSASSNVPPSGPVYLLDGKPHRLCDCDPFKETCRLGRKRTLATAEFNRCLLPAPDVLIAGAPVSHASTPKHRDWCASLMDGAACTCDAELGREGFYEKLWKDFCSLQRGDMVGIIAKVEQYYRDRDACKSAIRSNDQRWEAVSWRWGSGTVTLDCAEDGSFRLHVEHAEAADECYLGDSPEDVIQKAIAAQGKSDG